MLSKITAFTNHEFGIINQTETLISYQNDFNIWTHGKNLLLKKHQRYEDGQNYCQLMSTCW